MGRRRKAECGLNVADVTKERIPSLRSGVRERAKGFSLKMASAEERSCMEGVYTVRKSERQGTNQRRCDRYVTAGEVFWLGSETNKERERDVDLITSACFENQFRW